jgi:hypothetical protein
MGLASYRIFGESGTWHVEHDGEAKNTYETKGAAFEAAIVAASLALRQGHEIIVKAPGSDGLQAATGARDAGQYTKPPPGVDRDEVFVCMVIAFNIS